MAFVKKVCNNLVSNSFKELPWRHAKSLGGHGGLGIVWGEHYPWPPAPPMEICLHERNLVCQSFHFLLLLLSAAIQTESLPLFGRLLQLHQRHTFRGHFIAMSCDVRRKIHRCFTVRHTAHCRTENWGLESTARPWKLGSRSARDAGTSVGQRGRKKVEGKETYEKWTKRHQLSGP